MAQTIKIKNSNQALKVPVPGDLAWGEIALNYADGKIYYKKSDGTVQSISGGGGGVWTKITTATTATPSKQYLVDTTSAAFIVTLPAAPVAGDYVYFMDAGDWTVHNLTIARNGSTIEGAIQDLVFDVKGILVQMVYDGTTWQVASNIGPQGASYTLNDPLGTPGAVTLTNATGLPLTTGTTGILPVVKGGTGTATPTLVAGTNVTVSGTWPNQTINASSSGTVTAVTGTAPVVSSGGTTPVISMPAATSAANGYMTSTYAAKLDGIASGATTNTGTVTSVAALTLGTTGTDVTSTVATGTTTPVITLNVPTASASNRGALSAADWATFNGKQAALGFTPENVANKGVANGYAPLDGSTKISSTYLPSYVDDVLEYANLAAITAATGETGKIYVALDTNKTYRWSGSAYVEISASPGSTDAVTEGSTNLYFTNTRARASISATQNITYNSTTGVITGPVLSGYLTAEADTLATVTARGATTTVVPTFSNGATINGNTVVAVTDNTNAALRITQLGTGNALLVEDSTNPDSSPFVINNFGQLFQGYTSNINYQALGLNYAVGAQQIAGADGNSSSQLIAQFSTSSMAPTLVFAKSKNATVGLHTTVSSGDSLGAVIFDGSDGTNFIEAARISAAVDGTPGTNDMPGRLVFSTTADGASSPTERMRIDSSGNVGIGLTPQSAYKMLIGGTLSDATSVALSPGATASSTVSTLFGVRTNLYTAASAFTLSSINHFYADAATVGSGSAITNQYGFNAPSNLTGATNNYGFYGNLASGTNRYNLYMAGTADNYLAGNLGIGTTSPTYKLDITGNNLGTTAGNQVSLARLFSGSGNADSLEVTNTRISAGSNWLTAGFRFQQKIDSTWMAWQQFNGGADGGIVWGAGTTTSSAIGVTEKMRLDASGRLSIGTVSSDSLLRVAGQIESTVTGYKFPDGTVQATAASGANWTKITANTTATTKKQYVTDTTAAAFTVTLPASPAAGDYVYFMDAGNWATNNLTVARNGSTIEASATDLVLDVRGLMVQLIYDGTTWQVMSNIGPQGPIGPAQGVGKVIAMAMIFGG